MQQNSQIWYIKYFTSTSINKNCFKTQMRFSHLIKIYFGIDKWLIYRQKGILLQMPFLNEQ